MDNPIVGCPGLGEPQTREETPPKKPEESPKPEPRKRLEYLSFQVCPPNMKL